jgi:hypothetical protein
MNQSENFQEIIADLGMIEEDSEIPRNVRAKIKNAMDILSSDQIEGFDIKVNRSLQELSELAEDPNVPSSTRMQIWSIVSRLESK